MKIQAAAVLLALMTASATANEAPDACQMDQAILLGGAKQVLVSIEIADQPDERAMGLMFRRDLPQGQGMLFIYEEPQEVSFWMRNTLIPLDLVFIDQTGVVRHVSPMAKPLDETPIPGAAPNDPAPKRLMVLEVPGGDAARLGIEAGMALAHPRLPQAQAKQPCL